MATVSGKGFVDNFVLAIFDLPKKKPNVECATKKEAGNINNFHKKNYAQQQVVNSSISSQVRTYRVFIKYCVFFQEMSIFCDLFAYPLCQHWAAICCTKMSNQ